MKYKRLISFCAALSLLFCPVPSRLGTVLAAEETAAAEPLLRSEAPRGFYLRMEESGVNLSGTSEEIAAQLTGLVESICLSGMNTIYFEAKPSALCFSKSEVLPGIAAGLYPGLDNLDCLGYLTDAAAERNIQVFAAVDPFLLAEEASQAQRYSQQAGYQKVYDGLETSWGDRRLLDPSLEKSQQLAVDYAVELLEQYPIAGIVFEGLFEDALLSGTYSGRNYPAEFLSLVRGSMPQKGQKLGLVLPFAGDESDEIACALAGNLQSLGVTEFTLADLSCSSYDGYEETIDVLEQRFGTQTTVYPLNLTTGTLEDQNFLGDKHQMGYRICYQTLSGMDGFAVIDAGLLEDSAATALDLNSDYIEIVQALSGMELDFARTLSITRPTTEEMTTTYSQYFIMGTSDPDAELTMNGEEVPRYGEKGAFGILVPLELGENEFLFEQEDSSSTVRITRTEPSDGVSAISGIVQSSIYPAVNDVVYCGSGKIEFQCRAPSGASVTGSVAGLSVSLTQTTTTDYGKPAVFYGSIDIPERYNINSVTNLGKLTYTLQYNGAVSEYTSNADLFVAGEDTTVKVMVNGYRANVYNKLDDGGNFTTTLSEGAVDSVDQKDYWNSGGVPYFYASCGGYIAKSSVTILEGNPDISNPVSSISLECSEQGETLRLKGMNLPAWRVAETSGGIAVHLSHTSYSGGEPDLSGSELIQTVNLSQQEDELLLDIALNDPLWGYDIQYDGTDTLIFIKEPPALSSDPGLPLSGTVIVLDPGHGDADCGALGVAGLSGATENILNFAVATAAKLRLEQLGATVYMTRESAEEFLELDERMQFAEAYYPDFFLSIHHNSVGETTDANQPEGVEIYYHTAYSAEMAENILSAVSGNTGRKVRGSYDSYYRVTRITCAPAALLETGFVPNPAEYEELCDMINIIEAANGICEGILASIPQTDNAEENPDLS